MTFGLRRNFRAGHRKCHFDVNGGDLHIEAFDNAGGTIDHVAGTLTRPVNAFIQSTTPWRRRDSRLCQLRQYCALSRRCPEGSRSIIERDKLFVQRAERARILTRCHAGSRARARKRN